MQGLGEAVHTADPGVSDHHYIMADPKNLRPPHEILWARIRDRLDSGPAPTPECPLVIIHSEAHSTPTPIMGLASLMSRLSDRRDDSPGDPGRDFFLSMEIPKNWVAQKLSAEYGLSMPRNARARFDRYDPQGQLALKTAVAMRYAFSMANLSRKRLMQVCLERGISTHFNDVVRKGDRLLHDHPDMKAFLNDIYGETAGNIKDYDILSPEVMRTRNIYMVANVLKTIHETGTPLVVQHCGGLHALGDRNLGYEYKDSLSALFRAINADVIPVIHTIPKIFETGDIPAQSWEEHPESVVFEGLEDVRFEDAHPSPLVRKFLKSRERQYLGELAQAFGPDCPFDIEAPDITEEQIKPELEGVVRQAWQDYPPSGLIEKLKAPRL